MKKSLNSCEVINEACEDQVEESGEVVSMQLKEKPEEEVKGGAAQPETQLD